MRKLFIYSLTLGLGGFVSVRADDKVDFEKQVYPLLKQSCVQCHRPAYQKEGGGRTIKPKAGIVLSSKEGITSAVDEKDKKILVPGDPKASRMVEVTKLPLADEYHFPPAGKAPQFTADDIALLEKWITQGAEFGAWTQDANPEGPEWDGKEKTPELQKAVDAAK